MRNPELTRSKPKPPPDDIVEHFFKVDQRSTKWHNLRLGIPTASRFATILAEGRDNEASKGRARLMRQLAGERLSGEIAQTFKSDAMQRGIDWEPEARRFYERTNFVELMPVGFVRRTFQNPLGTEITVGCSPDSLIGTRKALEIKTVEQEALIEIADKGAAGFPTAHRAQCQGTMWVADLDEIVLMIFSRGMPFAPTFRVERDNQYIARIKDEVERFDYELRQMVERNKGRVF